MLPRIVAILLFTACGVASAAVPTGKLPEGIEPEHYALHLTIDPRSERFAGEARIRVELARASDVVWLHARALEIRRVVVTDAAGQAVETRITQHDPAGVLELRFARALPAQTLRVAIDYDAPFNTQLEGLYKVVVGDDAYAVTQMEPISARNAFPGFDEPRFKTPFELRLTVPAQDVAVANTRQLRESRSADGKWKTLDFAATQPLPTYLVAFAVGPWDVVEGTPIASNAVRKHAVPLRGIGPRGSRERLGWALETAPPIVAFLEQYTAQPYPFDKLDLLGASDFSAGAMENAGLIVYRDALLLIGPDSPADRYRAVFNIQAHEIAHQWYGNLVTVPWWDDIWLNEAYATWAQAKTTAALKPEYHADLEALEGRLAAMANDSLLSARKVRQPIRGEGDIVTAFDTITYQKGAAVLAMFERWVGEERFRSGMRAYLARRAFGSGSSDDLIATLAEASGKGEAFAQAMRSFLDQPGVPMIEVDMACEGGTASMQLAQARYLPQGVMSKDEASWRVPFCARFGRGARSDTQCVLLEQPRQAFRIEGACPDWVLPNADARGYYRFALAQAEFAKLAAATPSLSPAEQIVFADALSAAFRRGTLPPATLLEAMPALAGSDMPQVATALLDDFAWIREHVADAGLRPALDAWAARLYAPRLRQLGWRRVADEPGTTTALRTRLADFLAIKLRDPSSRTQLGAQGRAALGLDGGKADLSRADADLLSTSLKVAVQDGGAEAFDAALSAFEAQRDTTRRYALLAGIGATRDAALGERARNYGLTRAVQVGEMSRLYGAQLDEPENRTAAWQWMTRHYEAYRARLSPFAQAWMPRTFAEGRCGDADAERVSTFFAPRIEGLAGGDRGLGQTLERMRQCGALRSHVERKPLAEWLATQSNP